MNRGLGASSQGLDARDWVLPPLYNSRTICKKQKYKYVYIYTYIYILDVYSPYYDLLYYGLYRLLQGGVGGGVGEGGEVSKVLGLRG